MPLLRRGNYVGDNIDDFHASLFLKFTGGGITRFICLIDPPFDIVEPAELSGPVVFNSPHSGRVYPRAFLIASRLDLTTLRRSEDSFVDELAAGVVARGYPLMRAHFPRCFVDVNREPSNMRGSSS